MHQPNVLRWYIYASFPPQQLWSNMYQKWQRHVSVEEDIWQEISNIKEHDKELKSRVIKLRK